MDPDDLTNLLRLLRDGGVDFVLVGGLAAWALGSPRVTDDVDVCAPLHDEHLDRLAGALSGTRAHYRMSPLKHPLEQIVKTHRRLNNLYLKCDLGQLDLLGEVAGVGDFDEVKRRSTELDLGGFTCRVLDLDALIAAKRAAGRPKDLIALPELEHIRRRRDESAGV